jgi:hypothetical protein
MCKQLTGYLMGRGVLNRTGPNTIANEYASVGRNRGMFEADRTQERRVNYTPTLIHRAAATYTKKIGTRR